MGDQCAQWLLGFSFGIHRNPLTSHCNPTELICSRIVVVESSCVGVTLILLVLFLSKNMPVLELVNCKK